MEGKGIAWLALVVGIVALILSWVAYNRSGVDLEDQIEAAIEAAMEEVAEEVDQAEDAIEAEIRDEVTEPKDFE